VAEGLYTAAAVARVAAEKGIEMPICSGVQAIIEGQATVEASIEALLARPFRAET
jgi:glycerol-3-phosphate dehydrogenase (NAD(P)+)